MTDNVPINQKMLDNIDLVDLDLDHGGIVDTTIKNGIATWTFADGHIHRVDVTDYSYDDQGVISVSGIGPNTVEPAPLTESEKVSNRQMALAIASDRMETTDPIELVQAADVLAGWLLTGKRPQIPQEAARQAVSDLEWPDGPQEEESATGRETGTQTPS